MTLMTSVAINMALGGPVVYGLIRLLAHGIHAGSVAGPQALTVPGAVESDRLAA
jgi:hypothetical protein